MEKTNTAAERIADNAEHLSKGNQNTSEGEQNKEKLNEKVLEVVQKYGQGHLMQHYYTLPNHESRKRFLSQLEDIDFQKSASLFKNVYLASKQAKQQKEPQYQPIKNVANRQVLNQSEQEFNQIGLQRISRGEAGVCIMSGGQGTRLGFDHPKGMYDIGLDSHHTLFEFFARRLLSLMNVVKRQFPQSPFTNTNMIKWYIMTSEMNNDQVKGFFKQHNYFGYDQESIVFFPQGGIPALDYEGRIVIQEEGIVSLAPGGNGVIYEEMLNKGVLEHMKKHGVKYIYLGPVDNILLKLADPTCLGYLVKNNFDIVSLYVDKISAEEKVGLHLLCNGKAKICEYTETTKQVKQSKDENGQFIYKHGNRATMFITRDFIDSITTNKEIVERINKSYHLAEKKIKYFDKKEKKSIKPEKNNGVKFELFYFDVFEETDKFGLFETIRQDEFAPVKNAEGEDSPASARQLLRNLHLKWIKNAGIQVQGEGYVEIDPLLSYNGEGIRELVKEKFGSDKIKLPVHIK